MFTVLDSALQDNLNYRLAEVPGAAQVDLKPAEYLPGG